MLTGVAVFLLIVIALLAIPVTLTFKLSLPQDSQNQILLHWAFGLVRVRLPSSQPESPSPKAEEAAQKTSRFKPFQTKRGNPFSAIRKKSFRRRVLKFVNDFWHAIHKENVTLRIRIGLGDPADTGQLWAIVGPVAGMLANSKSTSFDIEPDFMDTTFEVDGSGSVRFIPLQIIGLTVAVLLSPPVWQGLRQMHKTK